MNILPMALVLVVLTGCATAPKPELPTTEYSKYALSWFTLDYCNAKGMMPSDLAAKGRQRVSTNLNRHTFDTAQFAQEISKLNVSPTKPSKEDCNRLAMLIHEQSPQNSVQNQSVGDNVIQSNNDLINGTRSKNTYCNRIGSSTFCNTY